MGGAHALNNDDDTNDSNDNDNNSNNKINKNKSNDNYDNNNTTIFTREGSIALCQGNIKWEHIFTPKQQAVKFLTHQSS